MAVTDTLKDAAYVGIGFGVLGFQKAQVRRQELIKQLGDQRAQIEAQVAEGRKTVTSLASQLEDYVAPVRTQVESALPVSVQDLVKQARTTISAQEKAVRTRLGLVGAA